MKRFRSRAAFSLVEVTIALGVAAVCLVAVMGLLPVGINTNQASFQQTIATNILSAVVSDLRTVPKGANNSSKQYKIVFPNSANSPPAFVYFSHDGSTGQKPDKAETDTVFYATISYMAPPAGAGDRTATVLHVQVAWPYPGVNPQNGPAPAGFVETFISLDRN